MEVQEPEARAHLSQFNILTLPMQVVDSFDLQNDPSLTQDFPFLLCRSRGDKPSVIQSKDDLVIYMRLYSDKTPSSKHYLTDLPDFYYALSLTMEHDRVVQRPVLRAKVVLTELASLEHDFEEHMVSIHIDPLVGLRGYQIAAMSGDLNLPRNIWRHLSVVAEHLYECYYKSDATKIVLNPLLVLDDGLITAASTSLEIDVNAVFRQRTLASAVQGGYQYENGRAIYYTPLKGQVGCMANGAGLSMAVMDMLVQLSDGLVQPANFLDICGSTKISQIEESLYLVLSHPGVELLLVVVNGSVTRCDEFAKVLVEVYRDEGSMRPVVVRLAGNSAAAGRRIIEEAQIPTITLADTLDDAVLRAISLVKKDMHVHTH